MCNTVKQAPTPATTQQRHLHIRNIMYKFVKRTFGKMNDRLSKFLAAENISNSQFADTLGVAKASISHILNGRNKPSYDFIQSVMEHYPSLNIEWLLAGKGKMYKGMARDKDEPVQLAESPAAEGVFSSFDGDGRNSDAVKNDISDKEYVRDANKAATETCAPLPDADKHVENKRHITRITVFFDDNTFIEII